MFEYLFGIDTLMRKQGRRDQFKLVFFSPAEKPGNRLGEKAVKGLLGEMKKRDIQTELGHKMKGFEANKVKTEGAEFDADLILFMPGMTGNLWFDNSEDYAMCMWREIQEVIPVPTGCPSKPTWRTCKPKRLQRICWLSSMGKRLTPSLKSS
jgi:hypothetical protein